MKAKNFSSSYSKKNEKPKNTGKVSDIAIVTENSEIELKDLTLRRSFSSKTIINPEKFTEFALLINGGSLSVIFEDEHLS
jgi:hypothetical protein